MLVISKWPICMFILVLGHHVCLLAHIHPPRSRHRFCFANTPTSACAASWNGYRDQKASVVYSCGVLKNVNTTNVSVTTDTFCTVLYCTVLYYEAFTLWPHTPPFLCICIYSPVDTWADRPCILSHLIMFILLPTTHYRNSSAWTSPGCWPQWPHRSGSSSAPERWGIIDSLRWGGREREGGREG